MTTIALWLISLFLGARVLIAILVELAHVDSQKRAPQLEPPRVRPPRVPPADPTPAAIARLLESVSRN
jgi:hypothetical protein